MTEISFKRNFIDFCTLSLFFVFLFLNSLLARSYDLFTAEVFLALLLCLIPALLMCLLISLRPATLRPLLYALVIAGFTLLSLGSTITRFADPFVGEWMAVPATLMVLFLPASILAWILRKNIGVITLATLGTTLLASFLITQGIANPRQIVEAPAPPKSDAPPIIHLVLDQQIGISGLNDDLPGAAKMRRELIALYESFGFRIFPNAFSHFATTAESLPNLMNGSLEPRAVEWVRSKADGNLAIHKNNWFRKLKAEGYSIEVLQTTYLDFCTDKKATVTRCETFNFTSIGALQNIDLSVWEKVRFLIFYLLDNDFERVSRLLRFSWFTLQRAAESLGWNLPDWTGRGHFLSPIISRDMFSEAALRLEELGPGEALFAHILLPHHPYMLDAQCNTKRDLDHWLNRSETLWWLSIPSPMKRLRKRHSAYLEQMRCSNSLLRGLLKRVESLRLAKDATVVIHGDHGSLITFLDPLHSHKDRLVRSDILSTYSTLFALRSPKIEAGTDERFSSVQALFATYLLNQNNLKEHSRVFLRPNRSLLGSNQTSLPMVRPGGVKSGPSPGDFTAER